MFVTYPDVRYLSACAPVRHPMGPTQTPAASGIATAPAPLRASPPAPLRASPPAPLRASPPGAPRPRPHPKVARNSPSNPSTFEMRCPELQRFWAHSKTDRVKLRARFVGKCMHLRDIRSARAPDPSPQSDPARPPGRPRGAGACRALHPRHQRASSGS